MTFLNSIPTRFFFLLILLFPAVSHGLTVTNNLDDGSAGSLSDAVANTPDGGGVSFHAGLMGAIDKFKKLSKSWRHLRYFLEFPTLEGGLL